MNINLNPELREYLKSKFNNSVDINSLESFLFSNKITSIEAVFQYEVDLPAEIYASYGDLRLNGQRFGLEYEERNWKDGFNMTRDELETKFETQADEDREDFAKVITKIEELTGITAEEL